MNRNRYRLVYNATLGMSVPVAETARQRVKRGGAAMGPALALLLAAFPALAQPTLPVPCGGGACGVNPNPTAFVGSGAANYAINGTQGIVTRSLDQLKSTRIVIAHRLSTVINADRIIVLQDGRIAQDGNYKSLIDVPGPFQDLAKRQIA